MAIKRRGKTLSLYKRVPKRYASIEPRKFVWLALHTDSETVAHSKAGPAWDALIEGWEAKLAGDTSDAEQRFAAARELAAVRGFRYMRADQVAKLPTDELLERVAAIGGTDDHPDVRDAEAVLGAAQEPEITVTKALELYWTLTADQVRGKSDDQLRRWKNPRIKAIKNFLDVIGDKAIGNITGAVFVKGVVRRFHAASLISGALVSVSGFSHTGPAGCQFRVLPDQRSGFCARAFA